MRTLFPPIQVILDRKVPNLLCFKYPHVKIRMYRVAKSEALSFVYETDFSSKISVGYKNHQCQQHLKTILELYFKRRELCPLTSSLKLRHPENWKFQLNSVFLAHCAFETVVWYSSNQVKFHILKEEILKDRKPAFVSLVWKYYSNNAKKGNK